MPPSKLKTQSNLHSFFGATKKKNPAKDSVSESVVQKDEEQKENTQNKAINEDTSTTKPMEKASSDLSSSKRKSPSNADQSENEKKKFARLKRRVIEDSDSEDEDEAEDPMQIEKETKDSETNEIDEKKKIPDESNEKPTDDNLEKHASNDEESANAETTNEDPKKTKSPDPKSSASSGSKKSQNTASFFKPKAKAASKDHGDSNSTKKKSEEKSGADSKNPSPVKDASAATKALEARPVSAILKGAAKGQFKSDATVLESIPSTWDKEMPYSVLCQVFGKIEEITGRLQIQDILTNLFRQIMLKSGTDLGAVLYLASNSVAPAYECVELGIGDAILIKAIGEATGTNPNMVKQKYEKEGDLGTVAQLFKSKQRTLGGFFTTTKKTAKAPLTATEVLTTFRTIANTKGNQSQKWKVDNIKKLLVRASDPIETKYIIRGLQGKLRIGLAQSTVLISLAHALSLTIPATIDPKEANKAVEDDACPPEAKQYMDKSLPIEKRLEAAVAIVKKAYSEVPSYEGILEAALKAPLQLLHKSCTLTPGIPVAPMLAKPTKSVQEVLKRLNGLKFTLEYKYDGERAQVHMLPDGTTKVFSRNLLDTSEKYPEVPAFVKEACKNVESFVLDAEVVAFNKKTGQLVPFQILSTRKKTEESAETAKVQVIVQAFDLMYLNGKSLLSSTLAERRALMKEHFQPVDGKFQYAKSLDHEEDGDTTLIEEFLDNAVKGQCEGLMVKTLEVNAIYEPSRRSLNWLKLKKDYLEGLGDSVDLVPLGAYHGRGKRTGVYGAYLLACYDPDTEEFQSVCKIGTGFSDEDLQTLSESLNKHKIPAKSSQYNVSEQLECDVWFDAVQVWEVKAADLSKSSAHRGAEGKTGEPGRGIGLRFPRFERLRDDKKPEDATTSDQILDMYYEQDAIIGGDDRDDDGGI